MQKLTLACARIKDRHTAENLQEAILGIVQRFCRSDIVVAIVHDNAAAMLAMKLPWTQYRCVAHSLQLAIRSGLDHMETTIAEGRDLVQIFTRLIVVGHSLP